MLRIVKPFLKFLIAFAVWLDRRLIMGNLEFFSLQMSLLEGKEVYIEGWELWPPIILEDIWVSP